MPMPKPKDNESRQDFLTRCMGDEVMVRDFDKAPQRYAVCVGEWTNHNKKSADLDFPKFYSYEARFVNTDIKDILNKTNDD